MAETPTPSGAAPVIDRRPVPRGVLPRGLQMWLMLGIAVAMVVIIMLTGRSQPGPRTASTPNTPLASLNPARLRDYQERLRALDERARLQAGPPDPGRAPMAVPHQPEEDRAARPDSLKEERKRREYDSLFAGNVVVSRRPSAQQPVADRERASRRPGPTTEAPDAMAAAAPSRPNLDEVADAVVRATARHAPATVPGAATTGTALAAAAPTSFSPASEPSPSLVEASPATRRRTPAATEPISPAGPLHRLLEGTVIDTVLTNRLDGARAAPVNCLVTNPIYSLSGQQVLIPAGSRVLGETKPVQAIGESRLAVAFHRLIFPNGRTVSLDHFMGLNQRGDAALRDQVDQHYWSTFGAAGAVGVISGLGQYLGTLGFGGTGDRTVVIAGGFGTASSEATAHVMNRFLNRLPTVTIREGHRVKVYLTSDLELPAYDDRTAGPASDLQRLP